MASLLAVDVMALVVRFTVLLSIWPMMHTTSSHISIPALHKHLLLPFCLPKGSA